MHQHAPFPLPQPRSLPMRRIYEVHTWQWLATLARSSGHPTLLPLDEVPDAAWDALAATGADTVWLMGIWQRSYLAARIAQHHPDIRAAARAALPDCRLKDIGASPYSVAAYVPDERFGGWEGLSAARAALAQRGMRLLLDYVPNHVAPDHAWPLEHPEWCIAGTEEDLDAEPDGFRRVGDAILACARDPFFPPWTDTIQLNPFAAGLRAATVDTLRQIAQHCDGVRCDMAMLLLDEVTRHIWGDRAGAPLATPFWVDVIPAVRATHPDFTFIAEAYWNTEGTLLTQGFDACYDKPVYDALREAQAPAVIERLRSTAALQPQMLHFIENHDEERAASAFRNARHARAAAAALLTLPGPQLLYDGQMEGRRAQLPVQLLRPPQEPVDTDLRAFYRQVLGLLPPALAADPRARWELLQPTGWHDNLSYQHLLVWSWSWPGTAPATATATATESAPPPLLVIINLSGYPAQARIPLPAIWTSGAEQIDLDDVASGATYHRSSAELRDPGLYVDLPAWGMHLLHRADAAVRRTSGVTEWSF